MELPKWSAMQVFGKKVTREQAAEIIVRTTEYVICNDREFIAEVAKVFGDELDDSVGWYRISEKVKAELKILPVFYLHLDRICSCYVGGPHGWLDWDGNISTNNYNIGKWPTVEAIKKEWEVVAEAFPFLDLMCTLWSGETCEDNIHPAVSFKVQNGEVLIDLHHRPALVPDKTDNLEYMHNFDLEREHGCTIQQLEWAVQTTRERVNERISARTDKT